MHLGLQKKEVIAAPLKEEYANGETWILYNSAAKEYYACTLDEEVQVESYYIDVNGNKTPASWRVTSDGTEFLVFAFSPYEEAQDATILLAYDRKQQLLNFIEYKYPYITEGYGIYQICKDGETERAILIQNLSEDELVDCEIMLNKAYDKMEMFGAEGVLRENKIILNSIVQPFGSVAIVLKEKQEVNNR